jgi:16S rRNA U1498 N3-methylase RsmE
MFVGPEGGFSQADVDTLKKVVQPKAVALGPHRLRVETASISLASCIISNIIK